MTDAKYKKNFLVNIFITFFLIKEKTIFPLRNANNYNKYHAELKFNSETASSFKQNNDHF